MAIIYGLLIECLDSTLNYESVVHHFDGLSHQLFSGLKIDWKINTSDKPYVHIYSYDFDRSVYSLNKIAEYSEAGIRLCLHLLDAPDFAYAIVGLDVERFTHGEFIADLRDEGYIQPPSGMILSKPFWEELNKPKYLHEFRPDYLWRPYFGERISPLQISEYQQIFELSKKLPGI